MSMFFFFKQKTAYEITEGDWSSDVCSSDLPGLSASAGTGRAGRAPRARGRGSSEIGRASCRKSVLSCVDLGGLRLIKKKKEEHQLLDRRLDARVDCGCETKRWIQPDDSEPLGGAAGEPACDSRVARVIDDHGLEVRFAVG